MTLPSNPTTGYTWIEATEIQTSKKAISSNYIENENPLGMRGVGGKTVITYPAFQNLGLYTI